MSRLPRVALLLNSAFVGSLAVASEADIERCRQAETAEARIVCLESALRGIRSAPADTLSQPRVASAEAATQEPAAQTELGAEQITPPSQTNEQRTSAQTVAIRFVGQDKLWVKLDSGQVWRQIDSDRTDLSRRLRNETELEVELWRSKFGGYRLALPAFDRTVKVRRLR